MPEQATYNGGTSSDREGSSTSTAELTNDLRITGADFDFSRGGQNGNGSDDENSDDLSDGGEGEGDEQVGEGFEEENASAAASGNGRDANSRIRGLNEETQKARTELAEAQARLKEYEADAELARAYRPAIDQFRSQGLNDYAAVQAHLDAQAREQHLQTRQAELEQAVEYGQLTQEYAARLLQVERQNLEIQAVGRRVFQTEFDTTLSNALKQFHLANPDEIRKHANDPSQIMGLAEYGHRNALAATATKDAEIAALKAQLAVEQERGKANQLKAVADAAANKNKARGAATPGRQAATPSRAEVPPIDDPTGASFNWTGAMKQSLHLQRPRRV